MVFPQQREDLDHTFPWVVGSLWPCWVLQRFCTVHVIHHLEEKRSALSKNIFSLDLLAVSWKLCILGRNTTKRRLCPSLRIPPGNEDAHSSPSGDGNFSHLTVIVSVKCLHCEVTIFPLVINKNLGWDTYDCVSIWFLLKTRQSILL